MAPRRPATGVQQGPGGRRRQIGRSSPTRRARPKRQPPVERTTIPDGTVPEAVPCLLPNATRPGIKPGRAERTAGLLREGLVPRGLDRNLEVGKLLDKARIGTTSADLLQRSEIRVELLPVATNAGAGQPQLGGDLVLIE
jgi:hypothetical protein